MEGHRERLRQRFIHHGLDSFDDHNILELLLHFAIPRRDTNALAHDLIRQFGSLAAVFEAPVEALKAVPGIGERGATLIHLVPEAARRYLMDKTEPGTILATSEAVGRYFLPRFVNCQSETVYIACLDAKLKVIDCRRLGGGGTTVSARLDVRSVVQTALLLNASAVVLAHNHTSGIALPSAEDEVATLQVQEALALVGITLVDHIVVAGDDFVSLADNGLLAPRGE